MLSPGETRPGEDTRGSTDNMFRALSRLVPNSGIQFIDFTIPRHIVDGVTRQFGQEKVRIDNHVVWALAPAKPAADLGVDDALTLRVEGRAAVAAVLDQWIPLPLLRFVARDGAGRARFDEGPYNWARLYIATPEPGHERDGFRAVAAFDTRIDPESRVDVVAYTAPTQDDVQFSSTFALTDEAELLASYLSEEWVQGWIESIFPILQPDAARAGAPRASGLQQVAAYLTLLSVLRKAAVLPSLQFFDNRPGIVAPAPVDIVLDIGTARSAAMLVESEGGRPRIADSVLLTLRDLSNPTLSYAGAFESRIAFSRPAFGSEALSRKSGRADAFHWPSLARTGQEAQHLSSQSRAADGATGIASPKAHLRDMNLREDTWRFAADARARIRRSQMITGRMLTHVPQTAGLLTGPAGSVKQIAVRPRYALSSMMSFLIAEIVLQALSAINAPVVAGQDSERAESVRQIRQIILCAPLTMPLDERDLLRERAEAAIDMLWRALDWEAAPETSPPRPVVRLGLDETLSAQLVFLYDQIAHRYGGDARTFLDVLGKSRPEFGVQPCVRFGALDIGGGHTSMTIVTYAGGVDSPIGPKLLGAQRSAIAGMSVLDQVSAGIVLPAIARHVQAAGGEDPLPFLEHLVGFNAASHPPAAYEPAALGPRLQELWLRPAALTLLKLAAGLSPQAGPSSLSMTLGELVGAHGALNVAVNEELSTAVEAIRSGPVDLALVKLTVRLSDIGLATRTALAPMVAALSRALVASDCDAVLLTGWAARLPVVKDLLLDVMPWRPDRIIALQDHAWQSWYPMNEADRRAADGKDLALIGALLALAGGERLGFGGGESGFPFGSASFGDSQTEPGSWQAAGRPS